MMKKPARQAKSYDQPAYYRITVRGRMGQTWEDCLEGMAVYKATGQVGDPVTILEGELSDQAALAGVLNLLYELQTTIISVNRLEMEPITLAK